MRGRHHTKLLPVIQRPGIWPLTMDPVEDLLAEADGAVAGTTSSGDAGEAHIEGAMGNGADEGVDAGGCAHRCPVPHTFNTRRSNCSPRLPVC